VAEHALSQVTFYTSKMEDFEGMSLSLSSGGGCYVDRGESGTEKYRRVLVPFSTFVCRFSYFQEKNRNRTKTVTASWEHDRKR
jgi:hypothetical protein